MHSIKSVLIILSLCLMQIIDGITVRTQLTESTLPTTVADQTLNTPSPINIPPTTVSHLKINRRNSMATGFTTEKTDESTEIIAFTPTTAVDLTNENFTYNSLQRTELPTDPMPPYNVFAGTESVLNENLIERRKMKPKLGNVIKTKWNGDGPDYIRIRIPVNITNHLLLSKQIPAITSDPIGTTIDALVSNNPCTCDNGICKCCTGMLLSLIRSKGCALIKYDPEAFSFEFKMMMNDRVLYKNKVSGRDPPPVCVNPRRLPVQLCVNFYDVYFLGRNMHLCMEMTGNFGDFELFNRDFECLRFGSNGVGLASAGDNSGLPNYNGGTDAEIDTVDSSEIEEYDENVRKI